MCLCMFHRIQSILKEPLHNTLMHLSAVWLPNDDC